jgi:hypothetical protein
MADLEKIKNDIMQINGYSSVKQITLKDICAYTPSQVRYEGTTRIELNDFAIFYAIEEQKRVA